MKATHYSNDKNDMFFNKRKIILFTILTIVIILFIVLFSKFVLDINFNQIYNLLSTASKQKDFVLWFFMLLLFPIYAVCFRIISFKIKLKEDHIYVKWYDWLTFAFIGFFINAITPFAIGCEPYNIFWLKSKGLSLKRATIIVSSTFIFGSISQILITWPSYFIIASTYNDYSYIQEWKIGFWLATTGLIIDLVLFIFFWTLSYSKHAHILINSITNWFRKKLRMSYKTKAEIIEEYDSKNNFKHLFIRELKNWRHTIFLLLGNLIWNALYYCSMIFAFKFMFPEINMDWFSLYNFVNISTTANNFVPIPGGEGTLQLLLNVFIKNGLNTNLSSEVINNVVFIFRLFSYYLLTFFGILTFGVQIWLAVKYKYNLRSRLYNDEINEYYKKDPLIGIVVKNFQEHSLLHKSLMNQVYKNFKIININSDTSYQKLDKLLVKRKIDYFIQLTNDDWLNDKFLEENLYKMKNSDMLIISYDDIKKWWIFKTIRHRWVNAKNKLRFIYKNNLSIFNIFISSKYLHRQLSNIDKRVKLNNFGMIYYLFINAKVEINKNIRISTINNYPDKNYNFKDFVYLLDKSDKYKDKDLNIYLLDTINYINNIEDIDKKTKEYIIEDFYSDI